jgi:lipopolysaccharide biosynthesis glycosyltransferase
MQMSEPADPIHVAVACDENYVIPLAAMLASLVAELDSQCELMIHVLGTDLSQKAWCKLQASLPASRIHWSCIELQSSLLTDLGFTSRPFEHISSVCFLRLLLPELLPSDVQKVLYLDGDMVIRKNIAGRICADISASAWSPRFRIET